MRTMLRTPFGVFVIVCGAVLLSGVGAFGYLAFFHNPSLLESHRLVSVEPVGIGPSARLYITRETCMRRAGDAEVFRIFVRLPDADRATPEVSEVPAIRTDFQAGCQTRTRRLEPPDDLQEGNFLLRIGLRWCAKLGNCTMDWFDPIPLRAQVGQGGLRLAVQRP